MALHFYTIRGHHGQIDHGAVHAHCTRRASRDHAALSRPSEGTKPLHAASLSHARSLSLSSPLPSRAPPWPLAKLPRPPFVFLPRAPSATAVFHHHQLRLWLYSTSRMLAVPPQLKLPCRSRWLRRCRHATARCATARMAEPSPAASGRADYATAFPYSRCTSCALPWGRLRGHIPQHHCRAAVVRGHASANHAGADYGHPGRS
jgi:hypothetical protein